MISDRRVKPAGLTKAPQLSSLPPKMCLQMMAPKAAPTNGATQNSQSWLNAAVSAKKATPVERAGFTEVLVTGIEMRWIRVSARPIAMGAKPVGANFEVDPKMTIRKPAVRTTSATRAACMEYPPGESSPNPFEAKPPAAKSGWPEAIE